MDDYGLNAITSKYSIQFGWINNVGENMKSAVVTSKSSSFRFVSSISVILLLAFILIQPSISQSTANSSDQNSIMDKPFGSPQYLLHATGHGTIDGPVKDDWLFLFPNHPDDKGGILLPDGSGGTFGYSIDYYSGPYNTPREVCAACSSKIGNGSMSAWNSWNSFSCVNINAKPGSKTGSEQSSAAANKTYSISGLMFNDSNGNGTKENGEDGLANWGIRLFKPDGYDTAYTNPDGTYKFSGLNPGDYKVKEIGKDGWKQTMPATEGYDISIKDKDISGLDFGNMPGANQPHTISGFKFNDKNGNGQWDGDETGVGSWTIKLTKPDGSTETATTKSDGFYLFENLPPDHYEISEESVKGWEQISPASGSHQVQIRTEDIANLNFGNRGSLTISGALFNDANGNGTKEDDENYLEGWTIKLGRPDGSENSDKTKGDGSFKFEHLEPGTYRVTIDKPDGWTMTLPVAGFADITLKESDVQDILFGSQASNSKNLKVNGTVYNDRYHNGTIMNGLGLSGWSVNLTKSDGNVTTTTTGPNGKYEFNNLDPGTYKATVIKQKGWKERTSNPVTLSLKNQSGKADFGFSGDLSLSGVKFNDTNGDGSWDRRSLGGLLPEELSNEPGMSDWKIKIKGPVGEYGTNTDPGGWYEFDELEPGEYTLTEELKVGWVQTAPKSGSYKITLQADDKDDLDFGNRGALSINGTKFNDRNGSKVRDKDEPGMEQWPIILTRPGGTQEKTFTDSKGEYKFENLEPGTYEVSEGNMTGWTATYPAGGVHKAVLSDRNVGKIDFGNQGIRAINGTKFYDKNGNGLRDAGEPGLGGWNIQLEQPEGNVVAKTTTSPGGLSGSPNGTYSFTKLAPGKYVVREEAKPGWKPVKPDNGIQYVDLDPNTNSEGIDFANMGALSISGMKFNDSNGDGIKGYYEEGLGNWTIILEQPEGSEIARTVTGSDGSYSFKDLQPGVYWVREAQKYPWTQTAPSKGSGAQRVELKDYDATGIDFGNRIEISGGEGDKSISGMKFYDLNADGVKDEREPGLEGFTIRLTKPDGTTVDATTGLDGSYGFSKLKPGTYTVSEVLQPGWIPTVPAGGVRVVVITDADSVVGGVDFGNIGTMTISGAKFDDANGNKVFDPGELGLPGWVVYLEYPPGNLLSTAITGPGGAYSFANLGPGAYYVKEILQQGWAQTAPAGGYHRIELKAADTGITGIDFGNRGIRKISGIKFDDRNGNGVLDPGERGLSGWTINLQAPAGGIIATTITGSDGTYKFENLEPWTFNLTEVLIPGWTQTAPVGGIRTVNLSLADARNVDFGNRGALTISGTKFNDRNGNRVRDPGEPGLSGWVINLEQPSGQVIARNITSASGAYSFSFLPPGRYTVREVQKPGWRVTAPRSRVWSVTLTMSDASGLDFGNRGILSISGFKFNDTNGNGIKEKDEKGMPGWTIHLLQAGTVLATNTTNKTGVYFFGNLQPGTYNLSEEQQIGWSQTAPIEKAYGAALSLANSSIDFGNRGALSISGTEFNDANGNGRIEAGEVGLSGWIINLERPLGKIIAEATTNKDGAYNFTNLTPGRYFISQIPKPGWARTAPISSPLSINLTRYNASSINFGNRGIRAISGIKFNDTNGNGIKESTEKGLGGWEIRLQMQNGTFNATNLTKSDGSYSIIHLSPGIYNLTEEQRHGWTRTLPRAEFRLINLTGGNASGMDFGNRWALSISGAMFNDTNGDGVWSSEERGLAGWTIQLETAAAKVLATNTTGKEGKYIFPYLTPGEYNIREVLKPGWNQTAPKGGMLSVNLSADSITDLNFGVEKQSMK